MTQAQAERLAQDVRHTLSAPVTVEIEGRFFVVTVETSTGTVSSDGEAGQSSPERSRPSPIRSVAWLMAKATNSGFSPSWVVM